MNGLFRYGLSDWMWEFGGYNWKSEGTSAYRWYAGKNEWEYFGSLPGFLTDSDVAQRRIQEFCDSIEL